MIVEHGVIISKKTCIPNAEISLVNLFFITLTTGYFLGYMHDKDPPEVELPVLELSKKLAKNKSKKSCLHHNGGNT
ncbi:MAG: hypothetical protein K9G67_07315 [Bacteroidales bacterium]|nr:hypothetical protein [Bacteroidales bacterium]MCF8345473.1 hypothetical protein [Bacteroidales bacterium]MCF8350091.1 hypothetical protein [Bacteroidales bacterium]MCF8376149.1 hypothetical protein [Bacteroidales bacterium]